jgi:hypothetical protein
MNKYGDHYELQKEIIWKYINFKRPTAIADSV